MCNSSLEIREFLICGCGSSVKSEIPAPFGTRYFRRSASMKVFSGGGGGGGLGVAPEVKILYVIARQSSKPRLETGEETVPGMEGYCGIYYHENTSLTVFLGLPHRGAKNSHSRDIFIAANVRNGMACEENLAM